MIVLTAVFFAGLAIGACATMHGIDRYVESRREHIYRLGYIEGAAEALENALKERKR